MVEFHGGFALCSPIQVRVGGKLIGRAPTDRCLVQHCEEFWGGKVCLLAQLSDHQ
jgi:hypothetical protein